jgi:lipoprotein-releasing system permease protein
MLGSYTTFIAWRYLKSKRKIALITIISLISLIGVTIGVSALIIVLSVFNGFNGLVTRILVEFDPAYKDREKNSELKIKNWRQLKK